MKERFLRFSINSDLQSGQIAIDRALRFIKSYYILINCTDSGDLKLVLSELVFNAIIHGNKLDVEKKVYIEIELNHDGIITSSIADEGWGYDYKAHLLQAENRIAEGSASTLESGRGVQLAWALSDSLKFNEAGNEIVFRKKVASNHVQHNDCRAQFKNR